MRCLANLCAQKSIATLVVTEGAAAAFIVGLRVETEQGRKYEPLVANGTFLDSNVSLLATETITPDEAPAEIDYLLAESSRTI